MNATRRRPALREGQWAIVCVESSTGIVLALTGEWARGDADIWRVYPTAEEAEASARELVASHPCWEAMVHDWHGDVVATYRGELPTPERPQACGSDGAGSSAGETPSPDQRERSSVG